MNNELSGTKLSGGDVDLSNATNMGEIHSKDGGLSPSQISGVSIPRIHTREKKKAKSKITHNGPVPYTKKESCIVPPYQGAQQ